MKTLFQIFESFRFAWKALRSNLLRTVLSLLGVTIGIFAIISVLTLVDSLEKNVKDSFNFLGASVIYVQKWPFPGGEEYRWWDYLNRPNVSYNEFKFLQTNLKRSTAVSIFADRGNQIVKRGSNTVGEVELTGVSLGYDEVFEVDIEYGRYMTPDEIEGGRDVIVLGFEVSKALFTGGEEAIGKEVKIRGKKYRVIGMMRQEGQSFLGTPSKDYSVLIPYQSFRKLYMTGTGRQWEIGSAIGVKGYESDFGLIELENELRGILRGKRGIRPADKDTFSLNRPEAFMNLISGVFDVLSAAGWIIGGFSILVGGFGIANIMFVSVKERTSIIGLQKSLGAKNYFILFQFLFEAIFLSLIGGLAGLFFVYLITYIPMGTLEVVLTVRNIVLGLGVSSAIGIISGFVPALVASRMDPVDAIRAS